jgi:hypothetical protein
MAEVPTQPELAQQFKNALKSYDVQLDIQSTGTYWDVTANATAAIGKEVVDRANQLYQASMPSNASSELLENWTEMLGIPPRKTGSFASGIVYVEAKNYPFTIPSNTIFQLANLRYQTNREYIIQEPDTVTVEAQQIGAEYNVGNHVEMNCDLADVTNSISQGIYGGSGVENDTQLLNRILINTRYRKTDGMLTDFLQIALNLYPYAEVDVLFYDNTIPYGVEITLTDLIFDYDKAAEKNHINHIKLSDNQVESAERRLVNYSIVSTRVRAKTTDTQIIDNLIIYVKANGTLNGDDKKAIRKQVRIELLKFRGDYLTPRSLLPDLPDYVISYYFNSFESIRRISPLMDSTNIGVMQFE